MLLWKPQPMRRRRTSIDPTSQVLELRVVPATGLKGAVREAIGDVNDATKDASNEIKAAGNDLKDQIRDAIREERRNGGNDRDDVNALNSLLRQVSDDTRDALSQLKDSKKDLTGDLKDALKSLRDLPADEQAAAIQQAIDAALTSVGQTISSVLQSAANERDAILDQLDDIVDDNGGQAGVTTNLVGTITLPGGAGVIGPAPAVAELDFEGDALVDGAAVTLRIDADLDTPFNNILRDVDLTINGVYDADTGTVQVSGGHVDLTFILGVRRQLPLEAEDFENITIAVTADGHVTSVTGDVSAEPIQGLTTERGLVTFNFQAV